MTTTTSDEGATQAQPSTAEAEQPESQVLTTTTKQTTSQAPAEEPSADEAVSEEKPEGEKPEGEQQETQAQEPKESDDEIVEWAKKKGIEIDPNNANEVKLARLQLENDRRFHEANQNRPKIEPPSPIEAKGDNDAYNELIERQNVQEMRTYVRDWFDANPDMKEHRAALEQIANERPWLTNLDDVRAHFLADPSRLDTLKKEGGREALQNLAQKQQQTPPQSGATNSSVYTSTAITPSNVLEMVDKHDQAWFEANHEAINKALSQR